jgi:hypothetical protein
MGLKVQWNHFTLIIVIIVIFSMSPIDVKADSESYWSSNWEKNNIVRLSTGATGYEGHEINRPAGVYDEVLYLYQRPTSRPVNPFLKRQDTPIFTFMDEYGFQPQTYWMHYQQGEEILWVGQICQLDSSGNLLYFPAATVLLKNTEFYGVTISDTVNCNELIGVCYYNGKWYAGERSGDTVNQKSPTYPRGGGLWESKDGINWVRYTSPEKEDPLPHPYGRELHLATLNGHLYGFYQASSKTTTLIRRLNTDENVCESPLDQGLVPFQIHPEGFDWQGYIPLRTGEDLGWFDGNTLRFQHFQTIAGREVRDAIPIGLYKNNLILTVRSGDEYTVLSLSEPFGEPTQIAANWMEGWGVRGIVNGDYAYLGVMCPGYSALDRLLLKESEDDSQPILLSDYDYWVAFVNQNEAQGKEWYLNLPYTWWHGLSKVQFIGRLLHHLTKQDEPLWILLRNEADSSTYVTIDNVAVSDVRANVGTIQQVGFHAMWAHNSSNVNGGLIFINGTEYVTNEIGWVSLTADSSVVQKKTWVVTEVNCDGFTTYNQPIPNPSIIWDSIQIIEGGVTWQTVWIKAVYEYDGEVIDNTKGFLYANDQPLTWSSKGSRWEYSTLLPIEVHVTDVTDAHYGLTVFTDTVGVLIVPLWLQFWIWITIGIGLAVVMKSLLKKYSEQKSIL